MPFQKSNGWRISARKATKSTAPEYESVMIVSPGDDAQSAKMPHTNHGIHTIELGCKLVAALLLVLNRRRTSKALDVALRFDKSKTVNNTVLGSVRCSSGNDDNKRDNVQPYACIA